MTKPDTRLPIAILMALALCAFPLLACGSSDETDGSGDGTETDSLVDPGSGDADSVARNFEEADDQTEREIAEAEATGGVGEPDMEGNTTPHRRYDAGPEDSVKVANATCPVRGGGIGDGTSGFIYNGWYINYCCPGCNIQFVEGNTDRYIARLKELTGVDVSVPPSADQRAMGSSN